MTYTFTNSNTNTYTIASTNTNTNTNIPFIEMQSCKRFAKNLCQKKLNNILGLLDFIQLMNPATLPGGRCLPGRTPLYRFNGIGRLQIFRTSKISGTPCFSIGRENVKIQNQERGTKHHD